MYRFKIRHWYVEPLTLRSNHLLQLMPPGRSVVEAFCCVSSTRALTLQHQKHHTS